ncbi:excalibur calcium-binding domain-containing protein [Rhodococcus sp. NPDC058514]|uniref:excalibur calcium-binding domain-containing protein n=1 Tax=unclassified Rhodococcus (in: high G+C Gram-positive bacteria) TaxID=192944 RepID=UPI003653855F
MTNPGPPPGWYPDPEPNGAMESQRYWNGDEWTFTTRPVPPDSTATTLLPVIPAEPMPEPEPAPRKRSKTVPLLVAGAAAVGLLAIGAGVMGSSASEPASSTTTSRTVPTTTAARQTMTAPATTTVRTPAASAPVKPVPLAELPATTYDLPAPVTAPAPAYVPAPPSEQVPAPPTAITKPQPLVEAPSPSGKFSSCDDAIAAGAAPMYKGDPGYSPKLDRDKDGIACDK